MAVRNTRVLSRKTLMPASSILGLCQSEPSEVEYHLLSYLSIHSSPIFLRARHRCLPADDFSSSHASNLIQSAALLLRPFFVIQFVYAKGFVVNEPDTATRTARGKSGRVLFMGVGITGRPRLLTWEGSVTLVTSLITS